MKNVTYILSHISKAIAFEWIANNISKTEISLSFILLNNNSTPMEEFLEINRIPFSRIFFQSKKDYPRAILNVRKQLKIFNTDVAHCHMRDANFIGLTAAKSLGIKSRIYTRHYSTYNHLYYPRAVKTDKIINSLATKIVAISENVKTVLHEKEGVDSNKIKLIHHGFDLERFIDTHPSDVTKLSQKYNPKNHSPVVGIIARYIDWKGHQYIIPALEKIAKEYPNALFIFANCNGPEKESIQKLIQKHIPNNSVEIGFEEDLFSLYQLFDIYLHTPVNPDIEAFGQTYVEALASGTPSIFTLSGVAHEFIIDRDNALVVDYENSESIYLGITELLNNKSLVEKLKKNGYKSVQKFKLDLFIQKLEKLYE